VSYSPTEREAAVTLFILALPLTSIFTLIGCIGLSFSKSREEIFRLHNQSRHVITVTTLDTPEDKAATTIQKHIRGYLERIPYLPGHLHFAYDNLCDKTYEVEGELMERARSGKTTVYLPQEMPEIILKRSGRKDAIKRFHQMQEVRAILTTQKSSHLTIPKANLCQEFLVEERLPINIDSYHNMGLYLSEPALFDEAVRELTRLFSKIYLSDLVSHQYIPLGNIPGVGNFIRYDNLPLYIVETDGKKEGKIGLIDLEHIENGPNFRALPTLARIFPLHLPIIQEEAGKLNMEFKESDLEGPTKRGQKYLQVGFLDHLAWLHQKGISTQNPLPFTVSLERAEELTIVVEQELLKLNQGINDLFTRKGYLEEPVKDFFTNTPEEVAKELAAPITTLVMNNIQLQLKSPLQKDLSDSSLVSLRSPIIKRAKLHEGISSLIEKNRNIQFKKENRFDKPIIAEQLAHVILQELVKGGEIFHFDPGYYSSGHEICWIRY
jgi:hypothetical protein